jgi:two-component system response regulator CpxR
VESLWGEMLGQLGLLVRCPDGSGCANSFQMAKILLIDDDAGLRTILQRALEREKHSVCAVTNGREALERFDDTIDLVIIDILMPRLGGIETIDALKKKRDALPIIAMSGGGEVSSNEYLGVAEVVGAACTLCKPFSQLVLVEAVDELLRQTV